MKFIALLYFTVMYTIANGEYIYPIDTVDNENLLVLYQKNLHHLELYTVNKNNKCAYKLLMSRYNPACVSLNPSKKKFIFLDNGQLKFKEFIKRSPGNFDFDYPIYNFHTFCWLDDDHCCFSAKCSNKRFEIFIADLCDKLISSLVADKKIDTMFPVVVKNTLFYIERTKQPAAFSIASLVLDEHCRALPASKKIIYSFQDQPIAFLIKGRNEHELFVIQHPDKIDNATDVSLSCIHIYQHNESWHIKKLFDFTIPIALINNSEDRLYESILPLMPRLYNDAILFCSTANATERSTIFLYTMQDESTHQVSAESWDQHYFAPLQLDNSIIYGGNIGNNVQLAVHEESQAVSIQLMSTRLN